MLVVFNYVEMNYRSFSVEVEADNLEQAVEKALAGEVELDLSPDTVVDSQINLEGVSDSFREVLVVNKKIAK